MHLIRSELFLLNGFSHLDRKKVVFLGKREFRDIIGGKTGKEGDLLIREDNYSDNCAVIRGKITMLIRSVNKSLEENKTGVVTAAFLGGFR